MKKSKTKVIRDIEHKIKNLSVNIISINKIDL